MHSAHEQLIFTQHLVEGSWFITVVQDRIGTLVNIIEEPLFETGVDYESEFEIEIIPYE